MKFILFTNDDGDEIQHNRIADHQDPPRRMPRGATQMEVLTEAEWDAYVEAREDVEPMFRKKMKFKKASRKFEQHEKTDQEVLDDDPDAAEDLADVRRHQKKRTARKKKRISKGGGP